MNPAHLRIVGGAHDGEHAPVQPGERSVRLPIRKPETAAPVPYPPTEAEDASAVYEVRKFMFTPIGVAAPEEVHLLVPEGHSTAFALQHLLERHVRPASWNAAPLADAFFDALRVFQQGDKFRDQGPPLADALLSYLDARGLASEAQAFRKFWGTEGRRRHS